MLGVEFLTVIAIVILFLGVLEVWLHNRTLSRLPIRIHVNGTRGKSSVTRLIAGGLREGGIPTCAKTTGTLPRMILPDGRELPVFRPSRANVIEQIRIVSAAASFKAQALVIECMALQPELQWLSEAKFIQATHGVITNARPDHLDIMGPTEADVAQALAGMVPRGGKLYTTEINLRDIFHHAAKDRDTELISLDEAAMNAITPADMAGFTYTEHPENVALALRVCMDLGVDRATAIKGMWNARPDPGSMTEHELHFFGRNLVFVNGFAANDPVSTEKIWHWALKRWVASEQKIAVFNCRADRPDRSLQLGRDCAKWTRPDYIVLMGTGTYIFAQAAVAAEVEASKLVFAEGMRVEEIFELIVSLISSSALIMGMGNIGGQGLDLVRYFSNRSTPHPSVKS